MKRTLSLVLALVMVLGTFGTVFAAEEELVNDAAEFLEDEGILLGDKDGDLMLEENLERRDAVILLSRLLGVEEEAEEFATTEESPSWEDARTDAYYVPFFAWAEENGYFEGDDEGNFNPRDPITAPEYALVLLRALGYEANGHESWAAALETAEDLGLLEDVEVEFEDVVVRGQMAVMTFNALGTEMNDSDETLAEYLGIEMPAPEELDVEDVYTENLAEVVVELTNADLVDELVLENTAYYELNRSGKIKSAEVVGDDVVLLVDGSLVRNREYTLTIDGLDRDMDGKYKFDARDNTIPAVESVEVLGEYGIKVTTSEPVKNPSERDFLIDGRNIAMNLEQYGRDLILTPYYDEFDEDAEELEIRSLEDYAGYKSTTAVFDIEIIEDDEAPEVVKVYFYEDGKDVFVEFDKDIYEDSVKAEDGRNRGNASYEDGRRTFYATGAKKEDTNTVKYTFANEWDEDFELEIQGVENHSKVAMERTTVEPVEVGKPDTAAAVLENNDARQKIVAKEVDGEKVAAGKLAKGEITPLELEYDEDVKLPAKADWNKIFTIYEKQVNARGEDNAKDDGAKIHDVRRNKDGDEDILLVEFENLRVNDKNKNYDYILEINGLEDESGEDIARDYMDFEVVNEEDAKFAVEEIEVKLYDNSIEFKISFNDDLDRDRAEDSRNYEFINKDEDREDLRDLDGRAELHNDGETVTLVLPIINGKDQDDFFKDYDTLEISHRVENRDGDSLARDNRVWEFDEDGAENKKIEEPEVPGDGDEEITAEVKEISDVFGIKTYEITLTNADAADVEKVLVNDVEVEDTEIYEGKILFNVLDGSELELVQIVIDGEATDVTIK